MFTWAANAISGHWGNPRRSSLSFSAKVSAFKDGGRDSVAWTDNKDFPRRRRRGGETLAVAEEELWPKKSLGFNELARTTSDVGRAGCRQREGDT